MVAQVLHFPITCHPQHFPRDRHEYQSYEQNRDTSVLAPRFMDQVYEAYLPDLKPDPRHSPLLAESHKNLPPARKFIYLPSKRWNTRSRSFDILAAPRWLTSFRSHSNRRYGYSTRRGLRLRRCNQGQWWRRRSACLQGCSTLLSLRLSDYSGDFNVLQEVYQLLAADIRIEAELMRPNLQRVTPCPLVTREIKNCPSVENRRRLQAPTRHECWSFVPRLTPHCQEVRDAIIICSASGVTHILL